MKAPGVRQSMAWIHGWLGLVAGWILFAMFLTGTVSYFRPEITQWMQPEIRARAVTPDIAATTAVAYLQKAEPAAQQWYIYLPDDRTATTRVFVQDPPNPDPNAPRKRRSELKLDPVTGEPSSARETRGGEHFYRFHFQLQLPHPWGRWLAGLCAMAMLGAIISGVITHKRIFVDFFTLRWRKGQRSWLDAHNVSAVLALPFHAMITYTGLITLIVMYMPWPIAANYANPTEFASEAYGMDDTTEASGSPAPLTAIAPLVKAASLSWQGDAPAAIVIRNPNDASTTVRITRGTGNALNPKRGSITYSGVDGRQLSATAEPGPAIRTAGVMLGLHLGQFAGPVLRWSYFLLGLTGTAMVGTGLVLWTTKRKKPGAKPFFGMKLVERLNIGTIACLPAGMAAFLLANRLLPAQMEGRAGEEVSNMFWIWFGLAALACLRPVRRAWTETLAIAAMLCAAVPIVNAATTDRGLYPSLRDGDWLFVSFDVAMILFAATLAFASYRAARQPTPPARRRKVPPVAGQVRDATPAMPQLARELTDVA